MKRISTDRLQAIRNGVDIALVVKRLGLTATSRGRRRRFLCPLCLCWHTTLASRGNLAHCFSCGKSFNPIDLLVATRGCGFLEAVRYLESLR